ncbi:MAG: ABC transporter ATP-binding protein [Bacteroidetes bacterium]|nr:ABC transporter ATP-binding protein [Bacteroidota bacterium]
MGTKRKITWSAWHQAKQLMWSYRKTLLIGFVLMIISRTSGFVLPGTSKWLIDEVIGNDRMDLLVPLALTAIGATIVQAITSYLLSSVIGIAAQKAIMDMCRQIHDHIIHLSVRFFERHKSGELISRIMDDAQGIRNLMGTGIVMLAGGVFTAVLSLTILFVLFWELTLIVCIIMMIFGGGMAYAFRALRPIYRERQKIRSEVTGSLGETLSGVWLVKVYSAESKEQSKFSHGIEQLFRLIVHTIRGSSATIALGIVTVGLVSALMIILGGRAITDGSITLGDFVMYLFVVGIMVAPIIQMAMIGTQISEAFAGLDRIRELFEEVREDEDERQRKSLPMVLGEVALEEVFFQYDERVSVLQGVSLHASAGTTTALVGPSGSGKSTLVRLIMGFSKPQKGRILIDGQDLATLKLKDYRKFLGVVMQENFLFDGTIKDNISYAKPNASFAEIQQASQIANAHHFIEQFPDSYETIVGERGIKLSGGQRQRISIARAILADSRILVLDEATSNLDTESEALIQEGFRNLRRGRTTFVIAHRLSTIINADQILVMEEGKIVECGDHAKLYGLNGRYRELYDQQHKYEDDLYVNPGEDTLLHSGSLS